MGENLPQIQGENDEHLKHDMFEVFGCLGSLRTLLLLRVVKILCLSHRDQIEGRPTKNSYIYILYYSIYI